MSALDLLFQISGLVLLIGSLALGYRRWVAPHRALDMQQRGVLLLLIVTLAGGFIGSPVWWIDDPRAFSWDLPPLAGRMLAAAGWSFVALCLAALNRPVPGRIRLALIMLAVYLAPLAIAILLWHRDRFDPRAPITYAFFAIVAALLIPNLWFLFRPPRPIEPAPPRVPPGRIQTRWLEVVALITGVWGVALFLTDRGPSPLIWAWPGDLLTSRLIAVMLLTIMAGALVSRRDMDLARVVLRATIVYALALCVASVWGLLLGQPARPAYAITFAAIALGSALVLAARAPVQDTLEAGATTTQ
jgi:hypothetical protein